MRQMAAQDKTKLHLESVICADKPWKSERRTAETSARKMCQIKLSATFQVQGAGYWGQRAVVTAAHHNCFDALMADVVKHVGRESTRVFTTLVHLDTEMTLSAVGS